MNYLNCGRLIKHPLGDAVKKFICIDLQDWDIYIGLNDNVLSIDYIEL